MKRPKDMTPDELQALPEYHMFGQEQIDVPGAVGKVFRPVVHELPLQQINGDDVLWFYDRDGVLWRPVFDGSRWMKWRVM